MRRLALALTLLATTANAQAVKLQDHEISALLRGNTAYGNMDGVGYRHYFAPDGSSLYAPQGAEETAGDWRVQDGELQSRHAGGDWQGRFVMEYAGDFYWVSKTTPPTPFRVLDGQRMLPD